jgi:ubiquinone/menaquinone biosynthesis C-methylase UbiE
VTDLAALALTSDFSPIAARYDATRDVPEDRLRACYARLIARGVLPERGQVLDVGCGTGQVSLVLAAMGFDIQGFDISPEMIDIARRKVRTGWRARYDVADVRVLPAADGSVDAVVVSKLFQHVGDWQAGCRELLRVLRPGCCLIQVNDRGAFGNAVRKYFATRADMLGFGGRFPGVTDKAAFDAHLVGQGCEGIAIDMSDLTWIKSVVYADALAQIAERLFAEFWYLPDGIYRRILEETARWVDQQADGRRTVQRMTPWLTVDVFRKKAA